MVVSIGLVGCGSIGRRLAQEIQHRFEGQARLIGIYDRNPKAAESLLRHLGGSIPILTPVKLARRCQLLIEAASAQAVGELLPLAIKHRRSLLVMSTGGLLQHQRLVRKARSLQIPLYVPSGALGGIDAIKAGAIGKLRSVTLTTRKPPKAFGLKGIAAPRQLFQGSAQQAVKKFPQNINVSATLALAGLGPTRTRVRIVADPTLRHNIHEVVAVGSFGRLTVRTENRPSSNPKTSELAVLSAAATLRQIFDPIRVGT